MRRSLWVMLAGCYNPAPYQPCQTVCTNAQDCQPGFVCGGNGYCRPSDRADCSPDKVDDAGMRDSDTPDSLCLGTGYLRVCIPNEKVPSLVDLNLSTTGLYDTDLTTTCGSVQAQIGGPDVCVVALRNLTIPGGRGLVGVGGRPLALVATESITIVGDLDVSSRGNSKGAGSIDVASPDCTQPDPGDLGVSNSEGSGGGAGGSLKTGGGAGGAGDGGVAGGVATDAHAVATVRGGCRGADGAPYATATPGAGGYGGGAVYLIAGGTLTISGTINASGSGGGAAQPRAGGGGGGSGGFIGLDAKVFSIQPTARIFASGGSGSSGGGATTSSSPGEEATPTADPVGRTGVDGGGSGGAGHSSFPGGGGGGADAATTAGGGGGGGVAGSSATPAACSRRRRAPSVQP